MRSPTIVVLAGGRTPTPVGPDGERLYDYTVYDALACGFGRAVFVVRDDTERDVRTSVEERFGPILPVTFVKQFRPLGTGHAVASVQGLVDTPFAIVNADDFYGREAIRSVAETLKAMAPGTPGHRGCVAGYPLGPTLSEHGGVSRAVCRGGPDSLLGSIDEVLDIQRLGDGSVVGSTPAGATIGLTGDERVSMNLWGFTPGIVETLFERYNDWTYQLSEGESGEYRLSSAINGILADGELEVTVLEAPDDAWMGVRHRGDVEAVRAALDEAIAREEYPASIRQAMRG